MFCIETEIVTIFIAVPFELKNFIHSRQLLFFFSHVFAGSLGHQIEWYECRQRRLQFRSYKVIKINQNIFFASLFLFVFGFHGH